MLLAYDGQGRLMFFEQPKQFALHLAAAAIVVTWAIELAIRPDRQWLLPPLHTWLGRSPARWAVISVVVFAAVEILSTAFSRAPIVSLWGSDFIHLGYELYSFLALLVLFMAVALRLRGRDQVQRVIYVLVGTSTVASVYGVAQHFGWDPFGPGAGSVRVSSTFLNPIFFGSFLVMSLPMTMAAALLEVVGGRRWQWWILFAIVIGLQLAALWFTGSRGPMVGVLAGGVILIAVAVTRLERAVLLRGLVVSVGGAVVAALLVMAPAGQTRGAGAFFSGFVETTKVAANLAGVAQVDDSGLNSRIGIWRGAVELVTNRNVEPPETGISSALRPILGFGPNMYRYSYPLTAEPDGLRYVALAHNYPLQVLLEMGVAGFVTLLAIAGLIVTTILRLLWPRSSTLPDLWITVVAVGLVAALVGRAVEQMVGVARIGDLVPFWILMGLVVAVSESMTRKPEAAAIATPGQHNSKFRVDLSARGLTRIAGAIIVIVVVGSVFVSKDIQQLRGSRATIGAIELVNKNQATAALQEFERGIALAPDVTFYPILLHLWLSGPGLGETDPANKRALLEIGYGVLARAADRDPYNFGLRVPLAAATVALFEDGEEKRRNEVIERYVDLSRALPNYSEIQALAATELITAGAFDLALAAADRSVALGNDGNSLAQAWWARGVALVGLGDDAEAFNSFERATGVRPEDQWSAAAHGALALILEDHGKTGEATAHRARQAELRDE